MRPYRTLLSLIGSAVLCIVAWASDVHAVSVTVENLDTSTNAVLNTHTINFTSGASALPGCLSGYACNTVTNWPSGASPTYTGGTNWLRITRASDGYTSGPIVSVLNTASSASFGLNGMVFQGLSATTGRLRITLFHNFSALTTATRTWGFMENGSFLQPGGNVATPTVDTLTMQGTVDGTNIALTPISKNGAAGGASASYSFNLSPTASIATTIAGGTDLRYIWVYNYNNTGQSITSQFSDPPGGNGNCEVGGPSNNPNCRDTSVTGGVGVYGIFANDPDGVLATLSAGTGVPLPEPSSVLLLGLSLLSGGIFFALRLRKEKERETR